MVMGQINQMLSVFGLLPICDFSTTILPELNNLGKGTKSMSKDQYLIALAAPFDVARHIDDLRKQFGVLGEQATKRLVPHVTILRPFGLIISEREFAERFQSIASQQHSFTIHAQGYGRFPQHTVFVNVEPHAQLQHLHELLSALLFEDMQPIDTEFVYLPHLTIMRQLAGRGWEKAQQILRANPAPDFTWWVKSISLFRLGGTGWSELNTTELSHPIPIPVS